MSVDAAESKKLKSSDDVPLDGAAVADNANTELNSSASEKNNKNGSAKDVANEKGDDNGDKPNMTLGDIAKINTNINNTRADDLQTLYMICFEETGKRNFIKKNLRNFEGFDFDNKSDEFNKKITLIQKSEIGKIRSVCDILSLDKRGGKEDLSQRICEFLLHPNGDMIETVDDENEDELEEDEVAEEEAEEEVETTPKTKRGNARAGRPAGRNASSKTSSGRPRRSATARPKDCAYVEYTSSEESDVDDKAYKPKRRTKDDSDDGSDYNPSAGSDSDAGRRTSGRNRRSVGQRKRHRYSESDEEESISSEEEEEDSDVPRRKRGNVGRPKGRPVRRGRGKKKSDSEDEEEDVQDSDDGSETPKKRNRDSKVSPRGRGAQNSGRPKRVAATKKPVKYSETEEDEIDEEDEKNNKSRGSSEDDEPLAKKPKTEPPTDDEIKDYVKDILAEANLEEITMKTVCKEVFAKYPEFDLTHKKDFIKATVKSLISSP